MSNHNNHLPEGWELKKLGDIANISYGYTAKASYEKGDSQFLRITDIQNDMVNWLKVPYCSISPTDFDKYRLIDKDIVFARTGATTGKSYLVNNPPQSVAASYLIRLRLNTSGILSEFIIKYFQTYEYWNRISIGISGSTQGGFNASKLGELLIPIPPLEEQKRIVEILDEAFEGIEKAIANTKQNLINARELFESYLNNIFTTKGDDWQIKTIEEVANIINGGTPKSEIPEYWGGDIFWITPKDMGQLQSVYISETSRTISELGLSKSSAKLIKKNSVILSTRAPIGHLVINKVEMATNQGCKGLIPNSNNLETKFLFYYLKINVKLLNDLGSGTTFKELSRMALSKVNIPIPPLEVQKTIVNKLDNLSTETQRLEVIYKRKLELLEELKQSILERAFKGELTANK